MVLGLFFAGCAGTQPMVATLTEESMPLAVAQSAGPAQVPVGLSADGVVLLTTDDQHAGLYLSDLAGGTTRVITRSRNAGYYPAMTPGAERVGYKLFRESADGGFEQAAMVFDRAADCSYQIGGWAKVASTPAFAADGRVAVMLDQRLLIVSDLTGSPKVQSFAAPVETTTNLMAFDPSGSFLVLMAGEANALLVSSADGTVVQEFPPAPLPIWGPEFSPGARRIVFSTINGRLLVWDRDASVWLGPVEGESPSWQNGKELLAVMEEGRVMRVTVAGGALVSTETGRTGERWWVTRDGLIASQKEGEIVVQDFAKGGATKATTKWLAAEDPAPVPPSKWPEDMKDDGFGSPRTLVRTPQYTLMTGVPYVHQVYDVPDWFDGHWACNAVTAVMCLAYWQVLQPNVITVSRPEPRPSNFATYICERYTAGKKSFDVGSPDPKGREAWGAYGYIVRENWRDTKNHIADYMEAHGIRSGVDWSPGASKLRAEIDAQHPTIVLHSITLAGHYVVAIGYLNDRQTVITQDPYGDKNTRIYPHLDGRGARYDLPGSNNGYQNLRIVHCFIYSRGPEPSNETPG